jgi:hypothetical protein
MKHKRTPTIILSLFFWLLFFPGTAGAGDVELRIQLRDSVGAAVAGETVILQQLPAEESDALTCLTDASGECVWFVGRGLYQVSFTRPLDDVSALALAEGGLQGFGLTVGEEAITYHFTFHSDGRVYFDAVPEAIVPIPLIPSPEALHGGVEAAVNTPAIGGDANGALTNETPTARPSDVQMTAVRSKSGNSWQVIWLIALGLIIGGGLHLWSRRARNSMACTAIENRKSQIQNQGGGDA